jgi:hypothetical protein
LDRACPEEICRGRSEIEEGGLKSKNPKSAIPNLKFDGPMLFPRNALTSGPQACFCAEKKNIKVKMGKDQFFLAR